MKIIPIPRILLNHPNNFMKRNDVYDILGCILLSMGFEIPEKCKFPSELKLEIPYFTRKVRRTIIDTDLTIKILELDGSPIKEAICRVNKLLEQIGLEIKVVDV